MIDIKKFLSIVLILMLMYIGYTIYIKYKPIEIISPVDTTQDKKIELLQQELDKYKQAEQNEKIRQMELEALQNPEIINNEFLNVGELITYKGNSQFKNFYKESKWYGSKQVDIEIHYNFGIGINLSEITVVDYYEETAVLNIPIDKLELKYIEMDTEKSRIKGDKTFFESQYTPDDIKIILNNAQKSVRQSIQNDKSIFDSAMVNLKEVLRGKIIELGYSDVVYQ